MDKGVWEDFFSEEAGEGGSLYLDCFDVVILRSVSSGLGDGWAL